MQPKELRAAAEGIDDVPEWTGVLVEDRVSLEELRVPRHTHRQIRDGDGHVGKSWKGPHGIPLLVMFTGACAPEATGGGAAGCRRCDRDIDRDRDTVGEH